MSKVSRVEMFLYELLPCHGLVMRIQMVDVECVSDCELPSATTVLSIIILADTAQLLAPSSPCRAAAHMSPLTRNLDLIQ